MSLKHNTIWNLAGMGLPLLLGVISIPYLIRQVGIESIGILTLVWALIGYFSLFDFGLGRALTQQVSANRAAGQEDRLPSLVKSGLIFTTATGLIGGILLAVLAYPLGFRWLNVSQELQQSAAQSFLIAALGIPMTTVTTGLRGVLEAYEDFRAVNLLRLMLGIANFGFPVLSVMLLGPSLTWMIGSLVAARLVIFVVHLLLVNRKLPTGWRKAAFSRKRFRELFSFGAWMTVSNIVGPLMVTADRFVISAVLGANFVAYYSIPAEMLMRVLILPAALTGALFPRLAMVMMKDSNAALGLYRDCVRLVALVMTPICLAIAVGSYWGLSLWLGKEFAEYSWGIVSVMAVGILLNGIAQVPFAAIQAKGSARTTALLHIVELIIYLPVLFVCLKTFGLIGAAAAWSFRVLIDLMVLLVLAGNIFPRYEGRKNENNGI